jgi:hypothetical protein
MAKYFHVINVALLTVILPTFCGCIGDGSSSSLSGSVTNLGGNGGGGGIGDGSAFVSVEGGLSTIHNPEPASMLLLGGGMAAFAYYKARQK